MFQSSEFVAIAPEWVDANIEFLSGEDAIAAAAGHLLTAAGAHGQQYVTAKVARILQRYQHLETGAWFAKGQRSPYYKPLAPRVLGFGPRAKKLRYESGAALPGAHPLFPVHPERADWWDAIAADPSQSIIITEGFKKALAACSHGWAAIALRGVTMWSARELGRRELCAELRPYVAGREILLAFDQDAKAKTRAAVMRELLLLGAALTRAGAVVRVMSWDGRQGKGLDDAIAAAVDGAAWLAEVVDQAVMFDDYRKQARRGLAQYTLSIESRYPSTRFTDGGYMPAVEIQPGAIAVLDGNTGAGKTQALAAQVRAWASAGEYTIVLVPNNSLGKQTAQRLGLPHIHDYPKTSEGLDLLWADSRSSGGVVLCPDSLQRVSPWALNARCPINLLLDEANQVVDHLTGAGTVGDRLPVLAAALGAIARRASRVVLSEDRLYDAAIAFMEAISGPGRTMVVYRHRRGGSPWPTKVWENQRDFLGALEGAIAGAGDKPIYVACTAQGAAEQIELLVQSKYPELRCVRVDGTTNEGGQYDDLFHDPDAWLAEHRPHILIVSPSAKSGVSIEGGMGAIASWFQGGVWGLMTCHDTDTHMQMLARVRPAVPRYIYVPVTILAGQAGRPGAIAHAYRQYGHELSRALGVAEAIIEGYNLAVETAILEYRGAIASRAAMQGAIARAWLVERLRGDGHTVELVAKMPGADDARKQAYTQWIELRDRIHQAEAERCAAAQLDDGHTVAWAIDVLNSAGSSSANRVLARKVMLRDRFPGLDVNDPLVWLDGVIRQRGAVCRGAELQAWAENLDYVKHLDRIDTQEILGADIRAYHRLPKRSLRAALVAKLGLLDVLSLTAYDNGHPVVCRVKQTALRYADQLAIAFRIHVEDHQSPVEVVNKLVRKLGYKAVAVARLGSRGDRLRQYSIESSEVHQKFLEAAQRKAYSGVSTICNRVVEPHMQITDTGVNPPISPEWDRRSLVDIAQMIAAHGLALVKNLGFPPAVVALAAEMC